MNEISSKRIVLIFFSLGPLSGSDFDSEGHISVSGNDIVWHNDWVASLRDADSALHHLSAFSLISFLLFLLLFLFSGFAALGPGLLGCSESATGSLVGDLSVTFLLGGTHRAKVALALHRGALILWQDVATLVIGIAHFSLHARVRFILAFIEQFFGGTKFVLLILKFVFNFIDCFFDSEFFICLKKF